MDYFYSSSSEPGWACHDVKWTKDYLIKVWSTSGGGTRFEYRSYEDLSIVREVVSYHPFEDVEDSILINSDSTMRKIEFYIEGNLSIEGREEEEFQTIIEIQI